MQELQINQIKENLNDINVILVGAGITNLTIANQLAMHNYHTLILEKESHLGGHVYDEYIDGINVHKFGAHIFHTSNDEVWKFVNQFTDFNNYINSPIANYHGHMYNLPFNMNTFSQLLDVSTPLEAKIILSKERTHYQNPKNLEEQALNLVGHKVYDTLIKEYTEKQWGMKTTELSPSIIKRLPLRFTYDNNYFNDKYQGIPENGYTKMMQNMVKSSAINICYNFDATLNNNIFKDILKTNKPIFYSGPLDKFFNYTEGELEFRSLKFEEEILNTSNYQGNAVVNFTSHDKKYTRIIEHKFFDINNNDILNYEKTIISKEYPLKWQRDLEPYYSINNTKNNSLQQHLRKTIKQQYPQIIPIGRLGTYSYLNMDQAIHYGLEKSKNFYID